MSRRGPAGMSLAELLVAVAVLALVLLASTRILFRTLHEAAEQGARTPAAGGEVDVALDRIERDVRAAVALPRHDGGRRAGSRTLLVTLAGERRVAYEARGADLWRVVAEGDAPPSERCLARGLPVVSFTSRGPRLVEIALRGRDGPVRQRAVLARNLGAFDPTGAAR